MFPRRSPNFYVSHVSTNSKARRFRALGLSAVAVNGKTYNAKLQRVRGSSFSCMNLCYSIWARRTGDRTRALPNNRHITGDVAPPQGVPSAPQRPEVCEANMRIRH